MRKALIIIISTVLALLFALCDGGDRELQLIYNLMQDPLSLERAIRDSNNCGKYLWMYRKYDLGNLYRYIGKNRSNYKVDPLIRWHMKDTQLFHFKVHYYK